MFGDKKLGFGCMRLPLLDAGDPTKIDLEQTEKMVDLFLQQGFTYFDTGHPYHNGFSEKVVGTALVKRHPRDSFTIADKLPMFRQPREDELPGIFQEQLERLQTDYIDFYLLHNPHGEAYENAEKVHAFDFVRKLKEEGKVKHIGFSIHDSADHIDRILTLHPEMEFVQIQLNYIDWENEGIQAKKCYEVCQKHGKPVIVMEPVKGGTLVNLPEAAEELLKNADPNASLASWAIRYAASLDGVEMVLSGMSNLEQMEDNLSYMKDFRPFSEAEYETVGKVVGIINSSIAIPCTACQYCVKDCPKQIPIPTYFALYNAEKQDNKHAWKSQGDYYASLASRGSAASDCIKCGKCESLCPQHLPIRELLQDVAREFEG